MRFLGTAALVLISAAALSCFGGEDSKPADSSPEEVVRTLLKAIEDGDVNGVAAAIDPEYRGSPATTGVGDLIRLAELGKITIEDLELESEFQNGQEHARVFVTGRVVSKAGDAKLDDKVLLTSRIDGRWYVTSPNSDYWASQLRPSPADWQIMQADGSTSLPGIYVPPHVGADGRLLNGSTDDRAHVANDAFLPICTAEQIAAGNISSPLCYPSNPPTSGPHAPSAAPARIYTTPVGKEFLVHSMEHGSVVIWYNTNDVGVLDRLRALTETNISRGKQVILTPYPGMEPDTIAVTAWTRLDKFPVAQFSVDRIQRFIDAHERRFNPEGF